VLGLTAMGEPTDWAPSPVTEEDVRVIRENSPFTRSLNLSDSLILTGIASLEEEVVVTLLDKNTKETYVVTGQPNAQGWKMVEVDGTSGELEKITAKIAVPGGEVVAVRFDESQLTPGESKPAAGRGPRERGDGRGPRRGARDGRRGPPPEVRQKFAQLSEDQRRKLFQRMAEIRAENPDLSREEMRNRMRSMLDRAVEANR